VGADASDFARIEPLLKCFAENVFHVGGPGAGHIIKLLNNFIAQAICNATAEAFAVGQRAGVDLKKLVALVSAGLVNSGLFQIMSKTLDGQLDGMKFELNNARKDVRYYTHMAETLGVPTVMGEATHQSLGIGLRPGLRQQAGAVAGGSAGEAREREDRAAVNWVHPRSGLAAASPSTGHTSGPAQPDAWCRVGCN